MKAKNYAKHTKRDEYVFVSDDDKLLDLSIPGAWAVWRLPQEDSPFRLIGEDSDDYHRRLGRCAEKVPDYKRNG